MVQNIIDAKSMQEAMKKLQILRGKKFSKSGFGRPRFWPTLAKHSANKNTYAGPLPETAVTASIWLSLSSQ